MLKCERNVNNSRLQNERMQRGKHLERIRLARHNIIHELYNMTQLHEMHMCDCINLTK